MADGTTVAPSIYAVGSKLPLDGAIQALLLVAALVLANGCVTSQQGVAPPELAGWIPAQIAQAKLPAEFAGCWEMMIGPEQIDSVESYSMLVTASQIKQIPTTIVTCLFPDADGSMRTEIRKVEVEGNQGTVTNVAARFTSIDPEQHRVHLRTHFTVAGTVQILVVIPYGFVEDFYMEGDLEMRGHDLVTVRGYDFFAQNGVVLARVGFHADAHRVAANPL